MWLVAIGNNRYLGGFFLFPADFYLTSPVFQQKATRRSLRVVAMADPVNFWHILPYYVKKDVVHYLDFKTRCNLSYCSKSDLKLVKSTPIALTYIHWSSAKTRSHGYFRFETLNCNDTHSSIKFRDTQQLVDRLCEMLRAPNFCKKLLFVGPFGDTCNELSVFVRKLTEQNIRPKIRTLKWMHIANDDFCEFLTRIDANCLRTLKVSTNNATSEQVERIVATEQWKKLVGVEVEVSRDFGVVLDSIIDKPKLHIDVLDISGDQARQIVKTFQEKNHPGGSSFVVKCIDRNLNVLDVYKDPGQRTVLSEYYAFYLKKFPLADEALELRVQLMFYPHLCDYNMKIHEINGMVVRKDAADVRNADLYDDVKKCVHRI